MNLAQNGSVAVARKLLTQAMTGHFICEADQEEATALLEALEAQRRR